MADPRPSADDPLIIFGSVSLPARQGPSTVNPPSYGGSSGGIPNFGEPQLGCSCLCCPPMPPGCMIGPLPCECACCDFLPFPPLFSCGASCSPAGSYSLVLENTAAQCVCPCGTNLSFGTVVHNRGFAVCGAITSVTIPKTGLWSITAKSTACAVGSQYNTALAIIKCCVVCAEWHWTNCAAPAFGAPKFGLNVVTTYDAGSVLNLRGRHDVCAAFCWSASRLSLYLVGESC